MKKHQIWGYIGIMEKKMETTIMGLYMDYDYGVYIANWGSTGFIGHLTKDQVRLLELQHLAACNS